jgi:hypothetical protein
MEILGLEIEREHIREDRIHRSGDVFDSNRFQIGPRHQGRVTSLPQFDSLF